MLSQATCALFHSLLAQCSLSRLYILRGATSWWACGHMRSRCTRQEICFALPGVGNRSLPRSRRPTSMLLTAGVLSGLGGQRLRRSTVDPSGGHRTGAHGLRLAGRSAIVDHRSLPGWCVPACGAAFPGAYVRYSGLVSAPPYRAGALASLCAQALMCRYPQAERPNLSVYTFGQPRLFNRAGAVEYGNLVPDHWALICQNASCLISSGAGWRCRSSCCRTSGCLWLLAGWKLKSPPFIHVRCPLILRCRTPCLASQLAAINVRDG